MTTEEINKLKADVTLDIVKSFSSKVITTQERIMFLKQQFDEASKKKEKDRSEEEKKVIREYEVNINTFTDVIREADIHLTNFNTLLEGFTRNDTVKL